MQIEIPTSEAMLGELSRDISFLPNVLRKQKRGRAEQQQKE